VELALKSALPPYLALMVCVPEVSAEVVKVAMPPASVTVASFAVPSLNVTLPARVTPNSGDTVAVKVTDCREVEGFRDEVRATVLVAVSTT
jgi:hypothetical protein